MFRKMFAQGILNNGVLSSKMAMPQKDSTTAGDNDFSIDRRHFIDGYAATNINKKWIGGNRDASQIVTNRRIAGVGSNLQSKPVAFTTVVDVNTVRDARHRVRSGGSIAPAKKTHQHPNAPIFY